MLAARDWANAWNPTSGKTWSSATDTSTYSATSDRNYWSSSSPAWSGSPWTSSNFWTPSSSATPTATWQQPAETPISVSPTQTASFSPSPTDTVAVDLTTTNPPGPSSSGAVLTSAASSSGSSNATDSPNFPLRGIGTVDCAIIVISFASFMTMLSAIFIKLILYNRMRRMNHPVIRKLTKPRIASEKVHLIGAHEPPHCGIQAARSETAIAIIRSSPRTTDQFQFSDVVAQRKERIGSRDGLLVKIIRSQSIRRSSFRSRASNSNSVLDPFMRYTYHRQRQPPTPRIPSPFMDSNNSTQSGRKFDSMKAISKLRIPEVVACRASPQEYSTQSYGSEVLDLTIGENMTYRVASEDSFGDEESSGSLNLTIPQVIPDRISYRASFEETDYLKDSGTPASSGTPSAKRSDSVKRITIPASSKTMTFSSVSDDEFGEESSGPRKLESRDSDVTSILNNYTYANDSRRSHEFQEGSMINHSGATVAMSRHDAAASNAEDDEFCLVIQKPSDPFTEESRTSFYKHHLPGFSRLGCTASTRYTDEIDFRSEMSD